MRFKPGDKVVFTNLSKIVGSGFFKLEADKEYRVIGVDHTDNCPYVEVNGKVLYVTKSEKRYIVITKKGDITEKEWEEIYEAFPFIPKSKEHLLLIDELEEKNEERAIAIMIDMALDSRDFKRLEELRKQSIKKKPKSNNRRKR